MLKARKVPGHAEYSALAKDTLARFHKLNGRLASGRIDVAKWEDGFHAILFDAHSDAWTLGRQRAGVPGKRGEDDERMGLDVADGQNEFLTGFAEALRAKDPRYFDEDGNLRLDQVGDRCGLYVGRMRGTANEAFVQSSEDDDEFDWELGPNDHCADCPQLAALGPYTKATMISHPGDGQTECLGACTCRLRRRRGNLEGFDRPDIYRGVTKPQEDEETTGSEMDDLSQKLFGTPATLEDLPDPKELTDVTKYLFGKDMSPEEIAHMVGAPAGSRVNIDVDSRTLAVYVEEDDLGLEMARTYEKKNGQTYASHDSFELSDDAPEGTGLRIFARQRAAYMELGLPYIETSAAGYPGHPKYIGYYVWARFGYNMEIPSALIPLMERDGYFAKDIHRLFVEYGKKGADWWKKNGKAGTMVFDLAENSVSNVRLDEYLVERGVKL